MTRRNLLITGLAVGMAIEAVLIGVLLWTFLRPPEPVADFGTIAESAIRSYASELAAASDEMVRRIDDGMATEKAIDVFAEMNRLGREKAFEPVPIALNQIDTTTEIGQAAYQAAWVELADGWREAAE